jgi:hypothetical protein
MEATFDPRPSAGRSQESEALRQQLNFSQKGGHHSFNSPVVGSRCDEYQQLRDLAGTHPALPEFQKAIYENDLIYLIPQEHRAKADRLAGDIYGNYLKKYQAAGVRPDNAVEFTNSKFRAGVTYLCDVENRWNTWNMHAIVEAEGWTKNGCYLPAAITALHEVMHIEETPSGMSKRNWDSRPLTEILPALTTIISVDAINKRIQGIPLGNEVNYGKSISWGGKQVDVGQLANFYRALVEKYGSVCKAVASPESLALIDSHHVERAAEDENPLLTTRMTEGWSRPDIWREVLHGTLKP